MATAAQFTYNGITIPTKAPNLPIAPVDYTQQYQDQVLNALRLYFAQIDNFTQSTNTPAFGATSQRPESNAATNSIIPTGYQFFDTTLNYPVFWNGSSWNPALPTSGTVSSFSAGTTGFTPSTATTGAVTLAGTLNVANGGTGVTTLTGLAYGNGTSAFTAATGTQISSALGSTFVTNATNATTATTANGLNTSNNYQIGSLGVGTASSGVSGEIRATNNITAYYSDDRMKTNLGNISNALEKLKTLNGFYYEANELAQSMGYEVKKEVGVSAQQVQAIMPEVVAPAPIDDKYLTVRYERLVPLLIEAIKELEFKVEAMIKSTPNNPERQV